MGHLYLHTEAMMGMAMFFAFLLFPMFVLLSAILNEEDK